MSAWNALLFALLVLVAFNALVVALLERAARRRKSPPARLAGGPNGSPLGSPARADEMGVSFVGAEFDQEWSQAEWAWPR